MLISKVRGQSAYYLRRVVMSEERFLRLPQILKLIPIGKSTLLEKVKKGEFPK
ncbi:hypothetical protein FACS189472_16950 [Alphaproteobacteria bacterium]|nr:hypothetical protein FACS189472_16950 [Alphaproteobacteria bacterium]